MRLTPKEKAILYNLMHKIVRLRDKEACLRCGNTENLQLSHIYPRGTYKRLEFDPDNVKLLCLKDHLFWWHRNPIEAKNWIETVISKKRLEKLKLRSLSRDKWSMDYKLTRLDLENELKKYDTRFP